MKKKILSIITALGITICSIPFNFLTVSAICCCKDGFDKSKYTLTGDQAQDVATIAKSQVGRTCSQFGYSGVDYGAWCDEYVADCLENAGCDSSIVAHGGTVADFEDKMRKRGAVEVSSPKAGDLVFFSWSHVEIVTKVENGVVYCAGGNNQGKTYPGGRCAGERTAQSVANSMGGSIRLYLRPNYNNVPVIPPTYSLLSANKYSIAVGEEITFTASSDTATGYTIGIDNSSTRYLTQEMPGGSLTLSFNEPGSYGAYVTSYNSSGYVDSSWIGFNVCDSIPTTSILTADKTRLTVGETVAFTATSDIASTFWLGIDYIDNGFERVATREMINGSYEYSFDKPGTYSAYVSSSNALGYIDSKCIYFTVYDEKPTYSILNVDKTKLCVGDIVSFDAESDYATTYWIGIDNVVDETFVRIATREMINGSYEYSFDKPGTYTAYVSSCNKFGSVDSKCIYFTVYATEKMFVVGDCNDDGKLTIADAIVLRNWLIGLDTELTNWQAVDLYEDGIINILDFCMLKNLLIS